MRRVRVGRYFFADEFNTSGKARVNALRNLCRKYLDPMRDAFGPCTVISGHRSTAHNTAVGGAPASRHLYHRFPEQVAADVVFAEGTPRDWAAAALELRGEDAIGGVGRYDGHVHVDLGPRRSW